LGNHITDVITIHKGKAQMDKKNSIVLIEYLVVATVLIATSFTPYKLVGMLVTIAYLIIERFLRKRESEEIGFNIKGLPLALRENWLFILLVVFVTPLITIVIGKLFLPEYFTHVLDRVTPYVKIDSMDKLLGQLLVLAFGEEIAFRAFLQGRLSLFIDPRWAIILSSLVFAAFHFTAGVMLVVIMDLLSVFVDSLLFGIIFKRSNNVFASTIAHFLGNSFGMFVLILFSQGLF
jgi:membrane protease YdiL (CAAX protease family)